MSNFAYRNFHVVDNRNNRDCSNLEGHFRSIISKLDQYSVSAPGDA